MTAAGRRRLVRRRQPGVCTHFALLHDGGGGKLLGDRAGLEHRVRSHRDVPLEIGKLWVHYFVYALTH